MAHDSKIKKFEAPGGPNMNPDTIPDAARAPVPVMDLEGIESKIQKALATLTERVLVLEAKTANMPIVRPVFLPQKENHNTDYVAGM
jgi:hypothetical protein